MVICNPKPVNWPKRLPRPLLMNLNNNNTRPLLEQLGHATLWSLHEVTCPPRPLARRSIIRIRLVRGGREGPWTMRKFALPWKLRDTPSRATPACIFVSVASRRRLALAHSRALPGWVTRRAGSDSDRRSGTSTVAGFFFFSISHLPSLFALALPARFGLLDPSRLSLRADR